MKNCRYTLLHQKICLKNSDFLAIKIFAYATPNKENFESQSLKPFLCKKTNRNALYEIFFSKKVLE